MHQAARSNDSGLGLKHAININTETWWPTHTVTSDSCSLVRFRGWLMAVMPNSTGFAKGGRKARRMALLATFMKDTMACQPLLLYQTCQSKAEQSNECHYNLMR